METALYAVFTLFFLYYAVEAILIGDIHRLTIVLLPSLVLSLLPLAFEFAMRVKFPPGVKAIVSLALLLHVAGGISRFYWKFAPFYDKLAHVVSALALFLLIVCFFIFLDYFGYSLKWRNILSGAIIITVVFMVSWELSEYVIDLMAYTSYNNGIIDSIGDLIGDAIGIVIGWVVVRYYRNLIPPGEKPGYLFRIRTSA